MEKKNIDFFKTLPGSGIFSGTPTIIKEQTSLKSTFMSILEKGVVQADSHIQFANKINNDIVKVLEEWIKVNDNERKKIANDGLKAKKTLEDQIANVARTKDNYEKLMKGSELLKDALVKCEKDEVNQPDNKKFKDNTKRASEAYNQSVEKGKKAEDEYQTAVKKKQMKKLILTKQKICLLY